MKKVLLGLIIGLVIALPAGAFAWSLHQEAQPIVGFDCSGPWKTDSRGADVTDKQGNWVLDPNGTDGRCSGTVYVFDNAGNKCYVVKVANGAGINCVKEN